MCAVGLYTEKKLQTLLMCVCEEKAFMQYVQAIGVCVCVCVCVCGGEEVKERRVLGLSVACVRGHMHWVF